MAQTAPTPDPTKSLRESFLRCSEQQDTGAYAALFSDSAVWDGPLGQNAIGPANISKSVTLMFAEFGPLDTVQWGEKRLAPGIMLVDVYQRMKTKKLKINAVPVAQGSIGPRRGATVRTTMIVEKKAEQWRIVTARVADLRIREQR